MTLIRPLKPLFCWLAFLAVSAATLAGEHDPNWIELFDGKSLDGWKASEHPDTWRVEDGLLVAHGERSHLFYEGPVANHDFRNFELVAEVRTQKHCNSGIFFHTQYQESGWPEKGYEVQINNSYAGVRKYRELKRTGSLYGVRNIYSGSVADEQWFDMRIRVVDQRICVWVNGYQTVDYIESEASARGRSRGGRFLSRGTVALQGHDPGSHVSFRRVAIRPLSDDEDSAIPPRATDQGYGVEGNVIDRFAAINVPVIDFHIHLRGGLTVEKAMQRQAVTGINSGVLRNIGVGWPIETDAQLAEFLDTVEGRPVSVGLQVNDRDWMTKHSKKLLDQLDFVLADTMIMPMPHDDSPFVKLWVTDGYTIDDPEAWMERYVRHNLRVLAEPVTILANPTYLPPPVADLYDELWTDERMRVVIEAAVKNNVALEINARSGLPHDRFLRMARKMGATFSFGTNNFDDKPIDMTRCFEAIDRYGLKKKDIYVPGPKE
jgi:3-keto-disaccharide hydrolase